MDMLMIWLRMQTVWNPPPPPPPLQSIRILNSGLRNWHMKFEIEISKQTQMPLKRCRLQTDGRTDRGTLLGGDMNVADINW